MTEQSIKVLLVDDRPGVAATLQARLPHAGFRLQVVVDPADAIESARRSGPDVIVQGHAPGSLDGFELLASFRRTAGVSEVPVIILVETREAAAGLQAFERGADDLFAGIPGPAELDARLRLHAERRRGVVETRRARRRIEEATRDIARLDRRNEVERASIELEARRDRDRLASITELGADLTRYQDFELLLDRILLEARRCCEAEAGALFTITGDQLECHHIQNDKVVGRGDNPYTHRMARRLSLESVAGTVALTGRTIRVEDAYEIPAELDCTYDRGRDTAAGYRSRALLSLPLRTSDAKIRGVIQLSNPGGEDAGRPFTDEDQRLVEHFAGLASVALERTALTRTLVMRMIAMAELRDPTETDHHAQRVAGFSTVLYDAWADRNGIADEEREKNRDRLRTAAMLHDVGKVGIPDAILKKPGPLDGEEFAIMQRHTVIGARLFRGMRTNFDEVARVVALHHHERWDGTGYPGPIEPEADLGPATIPIRTGLRGREIPLFARIVGLADVYDALSTARAYKTSWPEARVLEVIRDESGGHFDPALVEMLMECVEDFREVRARYPD